MAVEYKILCDRLGKDFPHYWELCIGSCHAATVMREDVRAHIRRAHKECGFKYLRFHGLFDDDMSVVIRSMFGFGEPDISFYNIDLIFDFLLDIGMKPFVEIGFMPEAFASGSQTCFHYKANVTPPADYEKWNDFIKKFANHLLGRYGRDEVSQWFFEVWNEPNLNFFFDGTQEEYFTLYENTVRTLKSVDSCFRVGGPATSVNAWILEFKNFCEKRNVPLDFITTHHYPSDDPLSGMGMNGPGKKGAMMETGTLEKIKSMPPEEVQKMMKQMLHNENNNSRDVMQKMAEKAKKEAEPYPLYYTEWNGSDEFDTSYQAAFVAHTISHNENLVEGYSYWTVSDIFEELGMKPGPFKNEFGIQTNHGIRKPVYQVFKVLHEAGDKRIEVVGSHRTAEVLALTDGKTVTLLVYNHDLDRRAVTAEEMKLVLQGRITGIKKAIIDEQHCNPLQAWIDMGSPEYLKKEHLEVLEKAAELIYEPVPVEDTSEQVLSFVAEPESVTIFKVEII